MNPASLIAVDWGTTSLRAYRVDAAGAIVDRLEAPAGIMQVPNGDFGGTFDRLVGPWLGQGRLPVVASGMIGSRQGWREAPYVDCPAGATDLANRMVSVISPAGHTMQLIPGVMQLGADGIPDVMRGEETQVMGCLMAGDPPRQVFVLPGTHSKWVIVEAGRIARFATFMTGELFAALRGHTILGRLMEGDADDAEAFRRGVEQSGRGGGLLRRLFSARTLPLFDRLPETGVASFLSGLLIGEEVAEAAVWAGTPHIGAQRPIIVGAATLAARYGDALRILNIDSRQGTADAAVAGIRKILAAASTEACS
ncbi:MAG TPA: 2-dehydro-3-deoxygalactonokinase [Methylomirabilota bacterium]|nr:2-dehydro-3-deoxygalactonokinase [Methylomirabilota bacterium]